MEKWYLELDFPTIVVFVSVIATLVLQLLLCFKAKKIFIKLLPIAFLIVSTIVFSICSATINGWDGLGYLFFALLSFYISSAGLRVLLSAHKTMAGKGGMKITHVNEIVQEVFEVTGFADILTIER